MKTGKKVKSAVWARVGLVGVLGLCFVLLLEAGDALAQNGQAGIQCTNHFV